MMSMLDEIMRELEGAAGPVTVRELAGKLSIEEGALEGMLGFLERKGRLSVVRPGDCAGSGSAPCSGCVFRGGCCPAAGGGAGVRSEGKEA